MTREAPVVLWFRRDLELGDHAALLEASRHSKHVLALHVLDSDLPDAFLHSRLRKLDEQLGGRLMLVRGDSAVEVVRAARAIGAAAVHVSADDLRQDVEVAKALADNNIGWVETRDPSRPIGTGPSLVDWVVPPYSVEIPLSRATPPTA